MSFLRRRMASDSFKDDNQDWDIVWDYTMGLPEDNGFILSRNGAHEICEITDDGLHVKSLYAGTTSRYIISDYRKCDEGIIEAKVKIISPGSISEGFIMMLSNDGIKGAHIRISLSNNKGLLRYNEANTYVSTNNYLDLNTDYIIKIVMKSNINYVYLNNNLVYQSEISSTNFVTDNRFLFQNIGEWYLKYIKFKKLS